MKSKKIVFDESINMEEVFGSDPDTIILARQLFAQGEAFNKLIKYCKECQCQLLDLKGHNLLELYNRMLKKKELADSLSEGDIKRAIMQSDVVSFDIFDTLLCRKTLFPEDVFEIVEDRAGRQGIRIESFKEKRIQAQMKCQEENPDIYDIYANFKRLYDLEQEKVEILCSLEIETEKEVLLPREAVRKIYQYALKQGKKVLLVSDMYLPRSIIECILHNNHIDGYAEIFISCDRGKLKLDGLFQEVGVSAGEKWLHIGDHEVFDCFCAEMYGAQSILINSIISCGRKVGYDSIICNARSLNEKLLLGMSISRIFNSPFALKKGKVDPQDGKNIGYSYIAPLVVSFLMWLKGVIDETAADDVLFASRDGWLILKLYRLMKKKLQWENVPEGKYFYTSRRAATMPVMDTEAMINMLIDSSGDMDMQDILRKRFDLRAEIIMDEREIGGDKYNYIWAHKDKIFHRALTAKNNYFSYMRKENLHIGGKYLFFDFVSSGTCQKALNKFAPFKLYGVYFGWNGGADNKEIELWSYCEDDSSFLRMFKFMETILTSDEPSLVTFDMDGKPVFSEENRTEQQIKLIMEIQQAICQYVDEFLSLFVQEGKINRQIPLSMYEMLSFTDVTDEMREIVLKDDWGDTELKYTELFGKEVKKIQLPDRRESDDTRIAGIIDACKELDNYPLEEADWKMFYHLSPQRESLFNWYTFNKSAVILEVGAGFGALTGLFSKKCAKVFAVEKNPIRAQALKRRYEKAQNLEVFNEDFMDCFVVEKVDYVILTDIINKSNLDMFLEQAKKWLKENGTILLTVENRYGVKYFCGVPDPETKKPFDGINNYPDGTSRGLISRAELLKALKKAGVTEYKLYYPVPDYRLPQVIYSDYRLPETSFADRVIPYYENQENLVALEENLYSDIIDNKVFDFFANSFLVECCEKSTACDVIYATMTTDRGNQHGFVTAIHSNDTVTKMALAEQGKQNLRLLVDNINSLEKRGIHVIPHKLCDDVIEMPCIKTSTLMDYFKTLSVEDSEEFLNIFDALYYEILRSSDKEDASFNKLPCGNVPLDEIGYIMKKAYIDMIPLNCFYQDGIFCFFDQEFVEEYYPAKYVLFRAIRYTYLNVRDAEKIVPEKYIIEKYRMSELWKYFEAEEARFVEKNRNYSLYRKFYIWSTVDKRQVYDRLVIQEKKEIQKSQKRTSIIVSSIEEVQKVEKDLLKKLIDVCCKYGLRYCAIYGTLLGAVRHKGIIPWDNDVDIALPREDYEILREIADKEFTYPYFLQLPENDPEAFYGGYAKLRNEQTTAIEERNIGHNCSQGIWIDIFPIDKCYSDERRRREHLQRIRLTQMALYAKIDTNDLSKFRNLSIEEDILLRSIINKNTHLELCKKLDQIFRECEDDNTQCRAILTHFIQDRKLHVMRRQDLACCVTMDFDDLELRVPVGYRRILQERYGPEYMIMPLIEKRAIGHKAIYNVDMSYKDYLQNMQKSLGERKTNKESEVMRVKEFLRPFYARVEDI